MNLEFRLDKFEGPLDLLLHLIEKNKVDIYDIPISVITDQYMDYVKNMKEEDPDVMSEFLVMAATLLDIKCRMLLPEPPGEEGEESDPREELVQKLLAHKLYLQLSSELKSLSDNASRSMYRSKRLPEEVQSYEPPVDYGTLIGDTDAERLRDLFRETMRRKHYRVDPVRSRFGKIEKETVDLRERELYIRACLNAHSDVFFEQLLENRLSTPELVVTFLLILELMKNGCIEVRQEEAFGDIRIHVVKDIPSGSGLSEEFT